MGVKFLGVDGGGSSLRALVIDEHGHHLRYVEGGPANVLVVGAEAARRSWGDLGVADDRYAAVVAGLAGADRPWVQQFWQTLLGPLSPLVSIRGDYEIAWASLTEGRAGCLAIFGTGSVFYGEHHKRRVRLGGYGWKVGDVGSGIRLGTAAIRAALANLEGYGPETVLTHSVRDWAQCDTASGLLDAIYRPERNWREVSELAASVFLAAQQGDGAAQAIMAKERDEILTCLTHCVAKLDLSMDAPVGLTGGLASLWYPWLQDVWHATTGRTLSLSRRAPVEGAALLAREAWSQKGRDKNG
ncbi:MAG: ATPase [Firmicutes bacterium]|nr:ATPase [Bacillota bacterium]